MKLTVTFCSIFVTMIWNWKYSYTKLCIRLVNIYSSLEFPSNSIYEFDGLPIKLVVQTEPNVVMGTNGTLYIHSVYVSYIV